MNEVERAAEVIDIGLDQGRSAMEIATALDRGNVLLSDADRAVLDAAERYEAHSPELIGCDGCDGLVLAVRARRETQP